VAKGSSRGHGRATTAAAAGGLALALAACGSGGKTVASASTTTTAPGRSAALQGFRQCMTGHGINLPQRQRPAGGATPSSQPPDGGGAGGQGLARFNQPPPGVDAAKYASALDACRSQLPAPGAGSAQFQTAFAAYLTCLRSHGVQTGDPSQGPQALAGVDRNSSTFQAASQACRALLPQRGAGPTTTTTTA
jgi:hypothetical protein